MEREIKFRGKCKGFYANNWVYGGYYEENGEHYIRCKAENLNNVYISHQIQPNTLGQCTGQKEKYDREIYEGDIVKDKWGETVAEVIFERAWFKLNGTDGKFKNELLGNFVQENIEVIGNIYDNANLLLLS